METGLFPGMSDSRNLSEKCKEFLDSILNILRTFLIDNNYEFINCSTRGYNTTKIIFQSSDIYIKFFLDRGKAIEVMYGDFKADLKWGEKHWYSIISLCNYIEKKPVTGRFGTISLRTKTIDRQLMDMKKLLEENNKKI